MERLVILSDNFGLNFSGGAIATCRIFEQLENQFLEIIVIAKQVGIHPFKTIKFLKYTNRSEAIRHIKSIQKEQTIFYGDFYMAYYFILARRPFFFTYHDNWPEQGGFGWQNYWRSYYFNPVYRWIFANARMVITVSEFKHRFVSRVTSQTCVIRNGINAAIKKQEAKAFRPGEKLRIIMLGTVDDRKFAWALPLFRQIAFEQDLKNIQIDIFGHSPDLNLLKELEAFSFVQHKGFSSAIDFRDYHLLLCTSKIENLSIAVCEALLNHTPVLTYDVGGLKEVIDMPRTGFLVPPANVDVMYAYLKQIYRGAATFDFEKQDLSEFDWTIAAQRYLELFQTHS